MATTIVTKNSSTASAVPTAAQLVQGELAVNVADKRIYTENNAGAVVELGTNPYNFTANHNGSAKLATTATGIDVTGTAVANGFTLENNAEYINVKNSSGAVTRAFGVSAGNNLYIGGIDADIGPILFVDNGATLATLGPTGLDVTGIVTMDGLDIEGAGAGLANFYRASANANFSAITFKDTTNTNINAKIGWNANELRLDGTNNVRLVTDAKNRLLVTNNGDISFYEDTGTTAKLFWDASAESLGIGTSGPTAPLHIVKAASGINQATDVLRFSSVDTDTSYYVGFQTQRDNSAGMGLNILTTNVLGTVSEAMRILPNGNVGIGTSSPSKTLTVGGTGLRVFGTASADFYSAGQDALIVNNGNANLRLWNNGTERMRIDSAGNVGIGTSSPTQKLHVDSGEVLVKSAYDQSGTTNSKIYFSTRQGGDWRNSYIGNTGNALIFATGGTGTTHTNAIEAMRITNTGSLLVGTTNTSLFNATTGGGLLLNPNGPTTIARSAEVALFLNRTGNSVGDVQAFRKDGTTVGSISVSASTTAYNTSSDQRLKKNIADADDAGSKIDAIQVRQYDWKVDGSHQDYGMIAQELQLVAPEAVSGDATSEEMMGVDYSKLVPMLIKEIQSLRNRVAQLEV